MKRLIMAVCLLSLGVAFATDRVWTGNGDGVTFTDMANWSPSDAYADGDNYTFGLARETPLTVDYSTSAAWPHIGSLAGLANYTVASKSTYGRLKLGDAADFAGWVSFPNTGNAQLLFAKPSGKTESTLPNLTNEMCHLVLQVTTARDRAVIGQIAGNGNYELQSGGVYQIDDMSQADSRIRVFTGCLSFGETSVGDLILSKEKGWINWGWPSSQYQGYSQINVPSGTAEARYVRLEAGAEEFRKTGAGTLIVDSILPASTPILVDGGALRFRHALVPAADAQPAAGAYLQLDADADGALELAGDGKIAAWKDVRPGETGVASEDLTWTVYNVSGTWTADMTRQRPAVASETWNGHKVVDFGTYAASPLGRGITDGASLIFTKQSALNVQEGFLVIKEYRVEGMPSSPSSVDAFNFNPFWFGMDTWNQPTEPFYRSDYPYGLMRVAAANANADYDVDGMPIDPTVGGAADSIGIFPEGVHVVHFNFKRKALVQTLFRQSGLRVGGGQLGEVIFYDRALTPQERVDTEAYLMRKWLNADHPLAHVGETIPSMTFADGVDPVIACDAPLTVASVTGSGDFVKGGSGVVTAALASAQTSYTVEDGALVATVPTLESEAYIHLDASRLDTMTWTDAGGGVTNVTKWADASGGAHWAQSYENANVFPTLGKNADGKPALDFGEWVTGDNGAQRDSAFMHFDAACTATKEIFAVWEFAPGASTNSAAPLGTWPANGGAWQVHLSRSGYHGYFGGTQYGNNAMIKNSQFWLDGEFKTGQYMYEHKIAENECGPHVVNVSVTNLAQLTDFNVNTIASERHYNWGGVKVSEVIVFDRALTEAQRQYLRAKLTKKWKGVTLDDPGAAAVAASVTVAQGGTLDLDTMRLSAATVGGAGTLDVGNVADVSRLVLDGPVTVKGALALVDGAVIDVGAVRATEALGEATVEKAAMFAGRVTVRLADLAKEDKLTAGFHPIVTCAGGCGLTAADLAADWTLETGTDARGRTFKLAVDGEGNPGILVAGCGLIVNIR